MPFDARTPDEIRDTLLADWQGRYADDGLVLDISKGSHHWRLASGLALVLALHDAMGVGLVDEILVRTATYTLPDHAAEEGIDPEPAVAAILPLTLTGPISGTLNVAGKTVQADDGTTYTVSLNVDGTGTVVPTDGAGHGAAFATCVTAGAIGTKPPGAVFVWGNGAPTGSISTALVAGAATVPGEDAEAPDALRARILERLDERPAGGNRADLRDWVRAVPGIDDAVIYPLLHPTYGTGTPGAVTILVLGLVRTAATSPIDTRVVSGPLLAIVAGYLDGTDDALGNPTTTDGLQLRPATLVAGNYSLVAAALQNQDAEYTLSLAGASAAPWAYDAGYAVLASPAPSTTTFSLAGDQTAVLKPGGIPQALLVNVGPANYRGGYYLVTPASVLFNSGTGNTDFIVPALPAAPVAASIVLPGLPNWAALQAAAFGFFDGLGPGDTSPVCRWPTEEKKLRARLLPSALGAALVQQLNPATGLLAAGVAGVLGATPVTPSVTVTPPAKTILALRLLSLHTAPGQTT